MDRHVQAGAPAAYTILRTEDTFDSHGVKLHTNQYIEAVRSDGSKVWRGTTDKTQQRMIYFPNGDFVKTNDLVGLKSTYSKLYDGPRTPRDPNQNRLTSQEAAAGWISSREERVGGYRAIRVAKKLGASDMIAIWYAPDLKCGILQQRYEHGKATTAQNLAAVIVGETNPALFQLSSSLKEVRPSQMLSCPSSSPTASRRRMRRSSAWIKTT